MNWVYYVAIALNAAAAVLGGIWTGGNDSAPLRAVFVIVTVLAVSASLLALAACIKEIVDNRRAKKEDCHGERN